jgi:hypothetical protein
MEETTDSQSELAIKVASLHTDFLEVVRKKTLEPLITDPDFPTNLAKSLLAIYISTSVRGPQFEDICWRFVIFVVCKIDECLGSERSAPYRFK